VAWLGGKLILARVKPELAENKVWPLVIGAKNKSQTEEYPFLGLFFFCVFRAFRGSSSPSSISTILV